MSRELVLYGIGGACDSYKTIGHVELKGVYKARKNVRFEADQMFMEHPNIEQFFIIENSEELRNIYRDLVRNHKIRGYVASNVEFKMYLEQVGMKLEEYLE